jgi:WD40 repeat protein
VIINWPKEGEYLPFRFLEWKDRKKKKVYMGEIINQSGMDEINHYETRERLYSIYEDLKSRARITEGKEEKAEIKEPVHLTHSDSKRRYDIVRKEIYPHLNIAEEILAGVEIKKKSDEKIIDVMVSVSSDKENIERFSLLQAVEKIWSNPDRWNYVLLGEGGMGKTTSLLMLWNELVNRKENSPVPLFLRLEIYNNMKPERRRDFIWYMIFQEYLNHIPTEGEIRELENNISEKIKVDGIEYPSVILLLDGFNEVTADKRELLLCLNDVRKLKGVQIIVSSRYDMRNNLNWSDFQALNLEQLEDDQIKNFMSSKKIEFNSELIKNIPLLRNPMMLTLYCGIEREMLLCKGDVCLANDYSFIENLKYKAEILHNFIESSLSRLDKQIIKEDEKVLFRLYLRYLLPRTGYEMEKTGSFEISRGDLMRIIREELSRYLSDEFLDRYPEIDSKMTEEIRNCLNPSNRQHISNIINILKERYCLIKEILGSNYSFLHQDFRDYFAAVYIKQKIEEGIKKGDNTLFELSERFFPFHLRSMIGELTGEPRRRPLIKGSYQKSEVKETLLDRALDLLRRKEMRREDYRVLNILEILKEKRVDLSDTDLSYLDLRQVVFDNVRLGHGKIKDQIIGADLKESRLRANTFLPQGHSYRVTSVCYSSDGHRILSGSLDRTIKEWNVFTGECISTYTGHSDRITAVRYSNDGKKILSGSRDGMIKEWDVFTGECIRTYTGHSDYVTSINYSNDCNRILSGSKDSTIKEWDVLTGECIRVYKEKGNFFGIESSIECVSYNSDAKRILSGSWNGKIKEWDTETGKCIRSYKGHSHKNTSADHKRFLSALENNTITGLDISIYTGHFLKINSVSYSSDDKMILSGSKDKTIKEWNRETGKCIRTYIGHSSYVTSVIYSNDGKKILSGSDDKTIKEWDRETGECIRTYIGHSDRVTSVSYSIDGKKILSGSRDVTIKEWDRETGECIRTYTGRSPKVISIIYSSDGKRIVSGSWDKTIKEWNIEIGVCIRTYVGHSKWVTSVSYSSDDKRILSGSKDGTIKEWDVETGECIRTYTGHSYGVEYVSYSSDGKKIVSGSNDNTIKEWDVETGECIRTYTGHSSGVKYVSYSDDGKRIFSGSFCGIIKEWDREIGECIRTYKGHSLNDPYLSYSSDGCRIILGSKDGTIKEWDMETGECIRTYTGHSSSVDVSGMLKCTVYSSSIESVSYNSNGKRIISGSSDNTIKEWDVETGECIKTYTGHSSSVESVSYSIDNHRIVSVSSDNIIKEWDVETGECIRTIQYIPGLFIHGVDMSNLHSDSEITEEEKKLLKQYRAILDGPSRSGKRDIVI